MKEERNAPQPANPLARTGGVAQREALDDQIVHLVFVSETQPFGGSGALQKNIGHRAGMVARHFRDSGESSHTPGEQVLKPATDRNGNVRIAQPTSLDLL